MLLVLDQVDAVRIGRYIDLQLEAENEVLTLDKVEKACSKLLANLIIESLIPTN